jgi:hypothetical protein
MRATATSGVDEKAGSLLVTLSHQGERYVEGIVKHELTLYGELPVRCGVSGR